MVGMRAKDSRDENGLVHMIGHHFRVGSVGNGKDMRRDFIPPPSMINLHGSQRINWITFIRINCNAKETRIRLQSYRN